MFKHFRNKVVMELKLAKSRFFTDLHPQTMWILGNSEIFDVKGDYHSTSDQNKHCYG